MDSGIKMVNAISLCQFQHTSQHTGILWGKSGRVSRALATTLFLVGLAWLFIYTDILGFANLMSQLFPTHSALYHCFSTSLPCVQQTKQISMSRRHKSAGKSLCKHHNHRIYIKSNGQNFGNA